MPLPRGLFWSQFAEDLLACGRFEETARHLTRALEAGPDARLSDLLGRAYFLQGKLDEAERAFREAADATPGDYAPYLDLGKLEIQRQRYAEALKYLDRALTLAPQQIDVLYGQARAYRLLGRTADADRLDETIKRSAPRPPRRPAPQPAHGRVMHSDGEGRPRRGSGPRAARRARRLAARRPLK